MATKKAQSMVGTLKARLVGATPLVMHRAQLLADPISEVSRAMKKISAKGTRKTDEDHEEMARLEWLGGLYWGEEQGYHIPGDNVRKALIEAGRLRKQGKAIERYVEVSDAKLIFAGADLAPAELYGSANRAYISRESAQVGGRRVMRTRPIFRRWEADVEITFLPGQIDEETVRDLLDSAGRYIGVCERSFRRWGRFSVKT